jgi:hypothetical protein
MKPYALLLAFVFFSPAVLGQGTVIFSNAALGVRIPIYGEDGITLLAGSNYFAQLYFGQRGTPDNELVPVGNPTPFLTGAGAGYFQGGIIEIPGIPLDGIARFQVRVWANENGTITSYEMATRRASSNSFDSQPLGQTPERPPASLLGLASFKLGGSLPPNPIPAPDPCDCFFRLVTRDFEVSVQHTPDYLVWNLSGTGEKVLVHSWQITYLSPLLVAVYNSWLIYDPSGNYQWVVSDSSLEPGIWEVGNISADGRTAVGTRLLDNVRTGFIGHPKLDIELPLESAKAISGDGRFVFGEDKTNAWVRLELGTNQKTVINRLPAETIERVVAVSHDGDRALFSGQINGSGSHLLWSRIAGLQPVAIPNFVVMNMSPNGEVLVGQSLNDTGRHPAFWSAGTGVISFDGTGHITGSSFNGSTLIGYTRPPGSITDIPAIWNSAGQKYALTNVIRNIDTTKTNFLSLDAISYDGRTITGLLPGLVIRKLVWSAGIALDNEGPRVSAVRLPDGKLELRFNTRVGWKYRVSSTSDFMQWTPVENDLNGNDAMRIVTVSPNAAKAIFFKVDLLQP